MKTKQQIAQEDRAWAEEFQQDEYLMNEALMGGLVEVADGCMVEVDGECPHGFESPLLVLGLI